MSLNTEISRGYREAMRLAVLAVALFLVACVRPTHEPDVTYRQLKLTPTTQHALVAVQVFEGDMDELAKADADLIGRLIVQQEGASEAELTEAARAEATKRGGTHFVWVADASKTEERANVWAAAAAGFSRSQCDQGKTAACLDYAKNSNAPPVSHHVAGGGYLVFRVHPVKWDDMPKEYRPRMRDAEFRKRQAQERALAKCRKESGNPEMCEMELLHDQAHALRRIEQPRALDPLGRSLGLREPREVPPFEGLPPHVDVGWDDHGRRSAGHLAVPQRRRRAGDVVVPGHVGDRSVPEVTHERAPGHDDRRRSAVRKLLDVLAAVVIHPKRKLRQLVSHKPDERGPLEAPPYVDHAVRQLRPVWPVGVRADDGDDLASERDGPRRVLFVNAGTAVDPRCDVVGVQASMVADRREIGPRNGVCPDVV